MSNYLYDAVGWESYEKNISEKALANTLYSVSVYDDDKIIDFGRLIGDGICFLYNATKIEFGLGIGRAA